MNPTTESPIAAVDPVADLTGRIAALRRRSERSARKVAELDARVATIDDEADALRLARERGEIDARKAETAIAALREELDVLERERPELVKGAEVRASVIGELETQLAEARSVLAVAEVEPLLERERELWKQAGKTLAALVESFDGLVSVGRQREALRASLAPEQRASVPRIEPWTPDARTFVVFLAELAFNPMRRDYQRQVGDPRTELVPDLTHRLHETHAFEGVDTWRWTP